MWNLFILFITVIIFGSLVFFIRYNQKNLKLLLSFSGAFLIGIAFMVLAPEIFCNSLPYLGLFVMIGFVIQLVLDLITEGAEHGHTHVHSDGEKISPFLLLMGLSIHAFLEGTPLISPIAKNIQNSLVLGIVVHNIPISLTLMSLFLHYGLSKYKSILFLTVFALMTPLGAIFGKFVITDGITKYFPYIMAVVIGIFLHVSTSILFETAENHKYNLQKFATVIFGLIMAFGVSLIE